MAGPAHAHNWRRRRRGVAPSGRADLSDYPIASCGQGHGSSAQIEHPQRGPPPFRLQPGAMSKHRKIVLLAKDSKPLRTHGSPKVCCSVFVHFCSHLCGEMCTTVRLWSLIFAPCRPSAQLLQQKSHLSKIQFTTLSCIPPLQLVRWTPTALSPTDQDTSR